MNLTTIIVILAFCYCTANASRFVCVQRGLNENPPGKNMEKDDFKSSQLDLAPGIEAPKVLKFGEKSYTGPRYKRISLSKPDLIRLLQEYAGTSDDNIGTRWNHGDYEYEL